MIAFAEFDEIENAIVSLELLTEVLPRCREQLAMWKWAIIIAHDALQAAIVCEVADTTGTSVLSKKSARAMLKWLDDAAGLYPEERLADFGSLLSKSPLSDAHLQKHILKLHELRNEFVHFTPKSWLLAVEDLPKVVGSVGLAAFLLLKGRAAYLLTGKKKRRIEIAVAELNKHLKIENEDD